MRTLLLDNFDSYTYNLFQLIAQVQGVEPTVLRNDAPEGADVDLREFDNIVISPGPGHPGNHRDFGFSQRILAEATIPVLGVCLGHQGIGLAESAEVGPTAVPRHGHLTTIRHDGRDLFDWVPQGFTAVRYHSFAIRQPLPPTLEATAWSEDGVMMGIRHRTRPQWGVQFHPESILTEHGLRLLGNFRDLTRAHESARRRVMAGWTPASSEPAIPIASPDTQPISIARPVAEPVTQPIPVVEPVAHRVEYRLQKRVIEFAVDAEQAFVRRFAREPRAFWLDSSRVEPGQARFSYFGDGTGPLAEYVRYDVQIGVVDVERAGQPTQRIVGSVFDYLKTALAGRRVDDASLPFDFTCGYVGYLGYEAKSDCGAKNAHQATTPDACWLFADRMVVVDHQEDTTYLLSLSEDTTASQDSANQWLDRTAAFLRLQGPAVPDQPADPEVAAATLAASTGSDRSVEPWLVRDREQYLADIVASKRKLVAGESYEVCVTNAAWLPALADPLEYHLLLREFNPAPYGAYLQFGDVAVASSSPERFLKISRNGTVEAKPIKGTAPRDARPEEDARLRASLVKSAKTRAENLMIVDLLRNDLGQVCEVGSVRVPKLMATETYATVHQLVSTVRGSLRPAVDPVDCVRACFPAGSMTGAPKLRTLDIIDTLETEARGVYSGAIGFFSCNGTADLNVVIRTAVFVGGRMHLGAGGAIVLDSNPEEEYAEMLLKMAAPMRAYWAWISANTPTGRAEPDPQDGFAAKLPLQGLAVRKAILPHGRPARAKALAHPGEAS
ncbi:MAG TPA: aminodeoxychorismate synthase component I [Kineosporiaceae bacterium]|nr:aminodeoxychorismate synthase component I [Kineosporiaceae bacterium]